MAEVKDGLPSTDFSRMNREYIKAVAENAAGGGGGGGGGGSECKVIVVREIADESGSAFHLNKTWQELNDAVNGGMLPVSFYTYPNSTNAKISYISEVDKGDGTYHVMFVDGADFTCSSPTDYPSLED